MFTVLTDFEILTPLGERLYSTVEALWLWTGLSIALNFDFTILKFFWERGRYIFQTSAVPPELSSHKKWDLCSCPSDMGRLVTCLLPNRVKGYNVNSELSHKRWPSLHFFFFPGTAAFATEPPRKTFICPETTVLWGSAGHRERPRVGVSIPRRRIVATASRMICDASRWFRLVAVEPPSLCVFQQKVPDIMEQKQPVPLVTFLKSWPIESMLFIEWWFHATLLWGRLESSNRNWIKDFSDDWIN